MKWVPVTTRVPDSLPVRVYPVLTTPEKSIPRALRTQSRAQILNNDTNQHIDLGKQGISTNTTDRFDVCHVNTRDTGR